MMSARKINPAPGFVLAFDAANVCGHALLSIEQAPRLLKFGRLTGTTDPKRRRAILSLCCDVEGFCGDGPRPLVAIEGTWQDTHDGKSIRAAWKLRRIVGWVEMAASLYLWDSEEVPVDEWRSAMLGKRNTRGLGRDDLKRFAESAVAMRFGIKDISDDEAEAILLGAYVAQREWLRSQRGGR